LLTWPSPTPSPSGSPFSRRKPPGATSRASARRASGRSRRSPRAPAAPSPPEPGDPEDASDCPLRRLGLLVLHRETGLYERRLARRRAPPELLGFVLALGAADVDRIELTLGEALVLPGGPGRVLALDAEGLLGLATQAEEALGPEVVGVVTLGAERVLSVRRRPATAWLETCYDRTGAAAA
jgi:hypothetical protein